MAESADVVSVVPDLEEDLLGVLSELGDGRVDFRRSRTEAHGCAHDGLGAGLGILCVDQVSVDMVLGIGGRGAPVMLSMCY